MIKLIGPNGNGNEIYEIDNFEIINLTPHPVIIRDDNGNEIHRYEPSGTFARLEITNADAGILAFNDYSLPLRKIEISTNITGLPAEVFPENNGVDKYYIVSLPIFIAVYMNGSRDMEDLLVVQDETRDENGTVNGCRALGWA